MKKIAIPLSIAALAASPAGAQAAAPVDLKIEGKRLDVLTDELRLRAKCASACTIGLARLNVLRFGRDGSQRSGAASGVLKGSKRLRAGRPAVLRVPLSPWARSHVQSAVTAGGYALVQVAVTLDGREGPYRSAALHAPGVPKPALAQDDLTVSLKPKLPSAAARYRVSVEGVQTTSWSYNRDTGNAGCKVVSNGTGKQTIRFRSEKPVVGRMSYGRSGAVLVAPKGTAPFRVPLVLAAERDGKVNAGVAGGCGETPSGGDGAGGDCARTGGRRAIDALLSFAGRNRLSVGPDPDDFMLAPVAGVPTCPIEPFADADDELDVMDAVHRMADPGGRDGKVILVARASKTDKLDGGSTTTKVRWTITFRKLGR